MNIVEGMTPQFAVFQGAAVSAWSQSPKVANAGGHTLMCDRDLYESIDTRQGERQVSLHEPGQQPQHPPPCPPTPVAEPLRFYRNCYSPEVPSSISDSE